MGGRYAVVVWKIVFRAKLIVAYFSGGSNPYLARTLLKKI